MCRGTNTILGPAGTLRTPAGKKEREEIYTINKEVQKWSLFISRRWKAESLWVNGIRKAKKWYCRDCDTSLSQGNRHWLLSSIPPPSLLNSLPFLFTPSDTLTKPQLFIFIHTSHSLSQNQFLSHSLSSTLHSYSFTLTGAQHSLPQELHLLSAIQWAQHLLALLFTVTGAPLTLSFIHWVLFTLSHLLSQELNTYSLSHSLSQELNTYHSLSQELNTYSLSQLILKGAQHALTLFPIHSHTGAPLTLSPKSIGSGRAFALPIIFVKISINNLIEAFHLDWGSFLVALAMQHDQPFWRSLIT